MFILKIIHFHGMQRVNPLGDFNNQLYLSASCHFIKGALETENERTEYRLRIL